MIDLKAQLLISREKLSQYAHDLDAYRAMRHSLAVALESKGEPLARIAYTSGVSLTYVSRLIRQAHKAPLVAEHQDKDTDELVDVLEEVRETIKALDDLISEERAHRNTLALSLVHGGVAQKNVAKWAGVSATYLHDYLVAKHPGYVPIKDRKGNS